ncbi:MAG: tetratricopeptide repeat protein [Nostoc sp. NMS1]|uniref:tetratricopeptide repeat protein n=1 Tax=Nostoc sp. NMS1 TaxID=2815388 RepID=UPI0025E94D61|nr:tetratricopeptide repeat protein [Nostoc sp. NMS1]MBN3910667.1 tetratricopeptide repeat protein [Nostoc sp. NMS1]
MKKPFILPLIATIGTLLFLPIATAQLSTPKSKSHTYALVAPPVPPRNLRQIAQVITIKVYAGDSRGSGILIAKNGQAYTVLTNTHVVNRGETYRIQTLDGKVYQARLINQGDSLKGNDLAVLQFQATVNYRIANLGDSSALAENQEVYTAGFPFDQKNLSFTAGKISLIADKPLVGGYQIGYTNETVQGMSGGAVLNREGKLIGVIGMGAAAILNDAYVYQDGTKRNETALAELRESSFAVPIATLAKVAPQLIAIIPKPDNQENTANLTTYTGKVADVDKIAQEITVRIDASNKENGNGSGVIIASEGQTYYVLTAAHVFQNPDQYTIVTPNGQKYVVQPNTIKIIEGVDIAVVQFQSQENYTVAKLGDYDIILNKGQLIFVSGFPGVNTGTPKRILTAGAVFSQELTSVLTKEPATLTGGYELLYTNLSRRGMSGGPILDHQGRVIGINAASDNEIIQDQQVSVSIFSFGIPISTFLGRVKETRIKLEDMNRETSVPNEISETEVNAIFNQLLTLKHPLKDASEVDWLNYGNELLRSFKLEDSLTALNQAIKLNPKLSQAYYLKGWILSFQEKSKEALADFDKATQLDPKSPQAWRMKSSLLSNLKKYPEALKAIDKAIEMQSNSISDPAKKIKSSFTFYPLRIGILIELERYQEALEYSNKFIDTKKYAIGYILRGLIYLKLKEYDKVVANFNRAIELKPNNPNYYLARGDFYEIRKENQKAFADYNQAIKLQPTNPELYINRAVAYQVFGDNKKVMADFNQAIKLDRKRAKSYIARAQAYQEFGDNKRAMADFTQAIELNPNNPELYITRAQAYEKLGDHEKAMADFNQAIKLDPDPWNYITRAQAYEELGDHEKAMADFNKAIKLDPKNPELYIMRATYEKDNERVIADYNKAIEIDPKNPKVIYSIPFIARSYIKRGDAYWESKDYQKALPDYIKAIEIYDNLPPLTNSKDRSIKLRQENLQEEGSSLQPIESRLDEIRSYLELVFSKFERDEYEITRAKIVKIYLTFKDYQNAIVNLTKTIQQNPNVFELYFHRGSAYLELKYYKNAIADLTKAIEIRKNNSISSCLFEYAFGQILCVNEYELEWSLYVNRGLAYKNQQDYLKAIKDFNKAAEILKYNRSNQEEYKRVEKYLIELASKNPEPYIEKAKAYYERGDSKNALANYTKAIEIAPQESGFYASRGYVYLWLKNYRKAFIDYNKAIALDSENSVHYIIRAKAYLKVKDYRKAFIDYNKAILLDIENSWYYMDRAEAYLKVKNYEKAFIDYNKAIEIYTKNITKLSFRNSFYYRRRAEAYLKMKDYDKAFADYDQAIALEPDFYNYLARAEAYLEIKNYEKAFADYNKAIKLEPNIDHNFLVYLVYSHRAKAYLEIKNYEKAFADYNKAIALSHDPYNYIARHEAYLEIKDYQKAINDYTKVIDFEPNNPIHYNSRGLIYFRSGNYQQSIFDYDKALELQPDYADSYYNRGLAYKELKDYQKAITDIQKAVQIYLQQDNQEGYQEAQNLLSNLQKL